MAFNTGIHSRYAPTPTWVAEGLATLFEAPGVRSAQLHANGRPRESVSVAGVPNGRAPPPAGAVAGIVAYDNLFRDDMLTAYAEAWALTFFLVETQPRSMRNI